MLTRELLMPLYIWKHLTQYFRSRKNKPLKDVTVAFRLEFERSKIKGRDSRIGNSDSKHLIQMMILKFESASQYLRFSSS